jgi:hypothetical protein
MSEIHDYIKAAMIGTHTHINLLKGLEGLTHKEAVEQTISKSHSTYETVYHMMVWQDILFKNINGEMVDWKDVEKNQKDWPSMEIINELSWEELLGRFNKKFKELQELIGNLDLNIHVKSLANAPVLKGFLVLNQHNSYHLGQISKNRVAQGTWPPSPQEFNS